MLGGLAAALIMQERIRTTETRAKRLRPVAEKLITLSKAGDVHSRRQALSQIEDRDVIHKLFADLGPRFAERNGGYTRILKLGPRKGDAAPMAIIELVDAPVHKASTKKDDKDKGRRFGRRKTKAQMLAQPDAQAEVDGGSEPDAPADVAEAVAQRPPVASEAGDEEPAE